MIYKLLDRYDYHLPETPPVEDILYYDLPKKSQYWRRFEWDFDEINKKWTDKQKENFVLTEIKRRTYGLHYMNNGVVTYMTGDNYYFLQYFLVPLPKEDGLDEDGFIESEDDPFYSYGESGLIYPQNRKYQREFFYYLDIVSNERMSEGGAVSKPRRVGITACFNAHVLNQATLQYQKRFSLMNKILTDAIEVNYDPIKLNIEKFPSIKLSNGKEIFRPKNKTPLTKKTSFVDKNKKEGEKADELNSHIYVVATVEDANDGTGTYRLIRDEVSKYPKDVDIQNMLFILRPVAKVGTRQVGKIFLFGTSAEKDTPNFEKWKQIYFDSDVTDAKDKRTGSGLYSYFISGKYAIEGRVTNQDGKKVELFDRYGECKEDLAILEIQRLIKPYLLKGDTASVQALKRQYPIVENDPFDSGISSACYDTFRLILQEREILLKQKRVLAGLENPFYTRGKLEWVTKDVEVRFVPDENGHWTIYRMPHDLWRNKIYTDRYGYINPNDTSPYLFTCDPIDYREALSDGSKAAIEVGSMKDSSLPFGGYTIDASYIDRPNNPNDVAENVRMAAIFWAAKGVTEANKSWLCMDLIKGKDDETNKRPNYGRFMLTYDAAVKAFRQWRYGEIKIAGIYSGTQSIDAYVRDTAIYMREPKSKDEIDYLSHVDDIELIRQWIKFDPSKTTKFDKAVAGSLLCMLFKNYNQKIPVNNSILSDKSIMQAWYGIKSENVKNPEWDKKRIIPV